MPTLSPLHSKINTDLSQYTNHDSFDVVVIGSGGAGFSAALNASLEGARVLLVERTQHVAAPPHCPHRPVGFRVPSAA